MLGGLDVCEVDAGFSMIDEVGASRPERAERGADVAGSLAFDHFRK